jgi:uncharacterized protein YigA (DUF484 family)
MSTQEEHLQKVHTTDQDVVRYLREHLDFFETHTHLLSEMKVPHKTGKAISLVERQVSVLRDQKQQLKKQLQELVQIARENDQLNQRMHRLTIGLMKAASLEHLFSLVVERLKKDFSVSAVSFRLFLQPNSGDDKNLVEFIDRHDPSLAAFEKVLRESKPVCGRLKQEQQHILFGAEVGKLSSVALLPLVAEKCIGLLALGSSDPQRFHPAKGTSFLKQMAELIACAIKSHS